MFFSKVCRYLSLNQTVEKTPVQCKIWEERLRRGLLTGRGPGPISGYLAWCNHHRLTSHRSRNYKSVSRMWSCNYVFVMQLELIIQKEYGFVEKKCWSQRTRDPNIRNPDATSRKPLAISLPGDNLLQNTHFMLYCQKIPISKYPFHRCIDWSLVTVSDKPFTPSLPTPDRAIWGFKQFNFSFFSQRN